MYVLTRDWNDFFAIQEDVFLRMNEIVRKSGTGFAFPSQTLYMGRDGGLDKELSNAAVQQVNSWRESNQLPFPTLTSSRIESLGNTLYYPPYGSSHAASLAVQAPEAAELLSAEPEDDDTDNERR